jgi:magnesium transporter
MRLASLLGPDLKDALAEDPEGFRETLAELHPEDVADLLGELPEEQVLGIMRVLPPSQQAEVLGRLSPEHQATVLQAMGTEGATALLGEMDPDDRVDVMQDLDDDFARTLLSSLAQKEPEAAEEVRELGVWSPETAGGLMTPDFAALPPDTKVWEAIEELRRLAREGEAETIYSLYVCGYGDKLLGVISLRELILSDPSVILADVMTENVVRVSPSDDQERVAETFARYDLSTVPVVDEHGRMLGVVTVDDVMDVVIEEATEDAQMMGGVVPLEESYFSTRVGEFVWKRAAWLVILLLCQLLTASVIDGNRQALQTTLGLAVFIPLIIHSGGSAGAQSSSLIIRALATRDVRPGDWARIAGRELAIGIAMGLALGLIGFVSAYFFGEAQAAWQLSLAVGTSIVAVVTLGTIIGSLLPLGIQRVGMDPAVSSTPFITTVLDVLGLLVYFGLAQLILTYLL